MKYVHHIPNVSPTPATTTKTASNDQPCALTTADNDATVPTTPFAERDDRQQAVAFGDVMGVPWRAALAGFRDDWTKQLDADQQRDHHEGHRDRRVQEDGGDPADLRDGDCGGVGEARRAVLRILPGSA